MTKCTTSVSNFQRMAGRCVQVDFSGGDITSDAGLILLGKLDRRLGLSKAFSASITDDRRQASVEHSVLRIVRQRVYGLAAGYEDLNDHTTLRNDIVLQSSVGHDEALASSSTLCRFEQRFDRTQAVKIHQAMVEMFIASFNSPPDELVLDFDATDTPVHGKQQGRFFHGYYDSYCFLPLYVFCGDQLLVAYLRPARRDGALHAGAILKVLTERLRQAWPKVKIVFRADSGFCRKHILHYCERKDVDYVVGLARNPVLERRAMPFQNLAKELFEHSGQKGRVIDQFTYAAKSWTGSERTVVVRAEHGPKGRNPRFVVTNRKEPAEEIYDAIYCARGEAENRIKEQQLDLFAYRTSCHAWWANQFRLLLAGMAYILIERLRALTLKATQWARARCCTIRNRLLKIGAVVTRNTRTIRIHMSSAYPYPTMFAHVAAQLE